MVVCGPSGVGKGTLISKLMQTHAAHFGFSVSHTTRAPRPGEEDGVHYHFAEKAAMQAEVDQVGRRICVPLERLVVLGDVGNGKLSWVHGLLSCRVAYARMSAFCSGCSTYSAYQAWKQRLQPYETTCEVTGSSGGSLTTYWRVAPWQGKFLEHAHVHDNLYGTSLAAVEAVAGQGKICILDIDVQVGAPYGQSGFARLAST